MAGGMLEKIFLIQDLHFQMRRYCVCKFHETIVEKGKASFYRMGHSHSITLGGKNVSWQQARRFQILRLRESIPFRVPAGQHFPDFRIAVPPAEFGSDSV